MRWNWGTAIFLVIILFLGACATFIIYTRSQKWSLVEEDYYSKELRHEEKLVKMRNASSLNSQLHVESHELGLVVQFPADFRGKVLSGNINVYRPSEEKMDVILPVETDTSLMQLIPRSKLSQGRYVVKVDWKCEGICYYAEQDIFIP
jgi:hypothetical protein